MGPGGHDVLTGGRTSQSPGQGDHSQPSGPSLVAGSVSRSSAQLRNAELLLKNVAPVLVTEYVAPSPARQK